MTATPGLRAAIYARYSTDKQKDTSVEDQIRLCRRLCEQKGWQVTEVFTDHALSGKNTLCPGYQRLIQAAECGQIDIIVAESQNRLSRDMADSANLLKRMNFFGVKIHTASENELDDMKVGVSGLVSTMFLKDLAQKTRRGLKQSLLAPDLMAQFAEEYRKAFNDAAAGACQDRQKAEHSLKKVEGRIANILTAIEDGMYTASMKDKMSELEREKARLEAVIADNPEPPALRLHPAMGARYREMVEDLARSLNAPEVKREATAALRALISEVRMVPEANAPGGHQLELVGELAGLMALGRPESKKPPLFVEACSLKLVAGVGFEPTTFRL
ncbi:recombinase family protein [Phaeobacter italicus]|uniref:recombinase family protein n=1 Tax=Phaeobacter italicus TaxID=481446 RepID=UPI001C961C58|nr:recombinase family protein [Phaeobacter italicus]MBY5978523.1 recombinase family protein [Phaeobacter italicus]